MFAAEAIAGVADRAIHRPPAGSVGNRCWTASSPDGLFSPTRADFGLQRWPDGLSARSRLAENQRVTNSLSDGLYFYDHAW